MRLSDYTVDSFYRLTRIANAAFFTLFFLSYPVYFITYYILFNGYLVYEGPVYIHDSLYCVSYCKKWCVGIILLGNILTVGTYSIISMFSSYYLAKCASYIISILTLPILSLIFYLSVQISIGTIWSNMSNVIYTSSTIALGGVLVSLMPPFCRRRAHTLAGILLFGMNACKIVIKTILWDMLYLSVLPVVGCFLYLLILWIHRMSLSNIFISETADLMHRIVAIMIGALIRVHFTEAIFYNTFKIEKVRGLEGLKGFAAIYGSGVAYGILSAVTSAEYGNTGLLMRISITGIFYLLKISFGYWIPYLVLKFSKGFEKAAVVNHFSWMRKNKQHFMYFEVCRHIIMLFLTLIPLCISYYILERYHGDTPSEMSITLSFMRLIFAYTSNGMDGALVVIYMGQRLSLPQKVAKRVTYTDIVHVYKPCMTVAHSE